MSKFKTTLDEIEQEILERFGDNVWVKAKCPIIGKEVRVMYDEYTGTLTSMRVVNSLSLAVDKAKLEVFSNEIRLDEAFELEAENLTDPWAETFTPSERLSKSLSMNLVLKKLDKTLSSMDEVIEFYLSLMAGLTDPNSVPGLKPSKSVYFEDILSYRLKDLYLELFGEVRKQITSYLNTYGIEDIEGLGF